MLRLAPAGVGSDLDAVHIGPVLYVAPDAGLRTGFAQVSQDASEQPGLRVGPQHNETVRERERFEFSQGFNGGVGGPVNAGFLRLGEPIAHALHIVPGIPVALGCRQPQPVVGFGFIGGLQRAVVVCHRQRVHGHRVALVRRLMQPGKGCGHVPGQKLALQQGIAHVELALWVASLCTGQRPLEGLRHVLADALAVTVQQGQVDAGLGVAALGLLGPQACCPSKVAPEEGLIGLAHGLRQAGARQQAEETRDDQATKRAAGHTVSAAVRVWAVMCV